MLRARLRDRHEAWIARALAGRCSRPELVLQVEQEDFRQHERDLAIRGFRMSVAVRAVIVHGDQLISVQSRGERRLRSPAPARICE